MSPTSDLYTGSSVSGTKGTTGLAAYHSGGGCARAPRECLRVIVLVSREGQSALSGMRVDEAFLRRVGRYEGADGAPFTPRSFSAAAPGSTCSFNPRDRRRTPATRTSFPRATERAAPMEEAPERRRCADVRTNPPPAPRPSVALLQRSLRQSPGTRDARLRARHPGRPA